MKTILHVAPDYLWVNIYIPSGEKHKCRNVAKLSNTPDNLRSLHVLFPHLRPANSPAATA